MTRRAALQAELEAMLELDARACVTPVARIALDHCDSQARKLLRAIEQDERANRAGYDARLSILSLHGGEPAARDIIRQAAFHRKHGALPAKRRAA